jgi:hypothetical protein
LTVIAILTQFFVQYNIFALHSSTVEEEAFGASFEEYSNPVLEGSDKKVVKGGCFANSRVPSNQDALEAKCTILF